MKLSESEREELIACALEARDRAYAPYSRFAVGAAIMSTDREIYTGCNVENSSFGATNCAERTAIFKAVSEGTKDFMAIAICGGPMGQPVSGICTPCGICRQVLSEFCSPDMPVILLTGEESYEEHSLGELLPMGFTLEE